MIPHTAPEKYRDWHWSKGSPYPKEEDRLGIECRLGRANTFCLIESGFMWHASDIELANDAR